MGTLLLALTLAAYALAMTIGRGSFGPLNMALLLAAVVGAGLFVLAEARAASPLIRLAMFRDPVLSASLAMSALVSTVMMATLVVGPFYLSRALGLDAALVGLVLSVGPLVAALTGVPAGRIVDRFGAQRMTVVGLVGNGGRLVRCCPCCRRRSASPATSPPIVVITAGYALFQTANNTAVMTDVRAGPAGRHFRHAQPVAQSRAHHRRIRHGRRVRARIGDDRHHDGAPRGRCHRHADHVRRRGGADRRRARHRGWSSPPHIAQSGACFGGKAADKR